MKFAVQIKGIAPLLMHRFSEEKLTRMKVRAGDKVLSQEQRREEASQYLYQQKGKLVQPAVHLEGTMVKAGTELKLAGSGKKTYKDLIKSSVFVTPEYIPHKNQKWEVDARAVVNPTTRGRSMCYRPRLEEWELEFQIEVLDDRADPDAIKEILRLAGLRQGIGAYRPRFGRFEVTKFTPVKEKKTKK